MSLKDIDITKIGDGDMAKWYQWNRWYQCKVVYVMWYSLDAIDTKRWFECAEYKLEEYTSHLNMKNGGRLMVNNRHRISRYNTR